MTDEEHRLIQGVLRDHPRPNFFDGKRPSGNCPSAREAIGLLREAAEEEKGRQLMIHTDGYIW